MKNKIHHAWFILISCCIIMISGIGILATCAGVFYKPISSEFNVGIGSVSFYVTIKSLVIMLMLPLAAKIFKKYNMKIILTTAFIVSSTGFACLSFSKAVVHLYIIGAITGVSASFIILLPVPILINRWFAKRSGTMLGIALAFSGVGGAVFVPLASKLVQTFGWRSAQLTMGLIAGALAIPFTAFVIYSKPEDIGLLPYGSRNCDSLKEHIQSDNDKLNGTLTKDALKSISFYICATFAALTMMVANISTHIHNMAESRGFITTTAAFSVSMFMLGITIGKILLGYLNDKIGLTGCVWIAATLGVLGALGFLFNSNSYIILFISTGFMGIATALATLAPPLLVKKVFGMLDYTSIYSYITSISMFIGAISVSLYGFIYDKTHSFNYILIIIIAALIISALSLTSAIRQTLKLKSSEKVIASN